MAKKPRTNPSEEFIKNSADIIKAMLDSAYTPIAKLASVEAYNAALDRISDVLNVPSNQYTRDDFRPIVVAVGNTLGDAFESKEYVSRFKKNANGYSFSFYKKPTQGGEITFSTMLENFPGSTVRNFHNNISKEDKLSIMWAMMAAAGFSFTPNGESFEAYYSPQIITSDAKGRQKRADIDEVEIATGDVSGIQGIVDRVMRRANVLHIQSMMNGSYQGMIRYQVEISAFGADVSVNIYPRVDLAISADLVNNIVETNDKSAVDYLVYAWMGHALDRATARARSKTKNLPAVDLRITSRKLKAVSQKFSVAKPRLNEYGFCINRQGIPMYVPSVDDTERFMRDHSNFSIDEEGYLKYEDVAIEWANKIVLVDWFNDVIVYTQVNGKLEIYRLLGYIPLDKSSEYVYLNSPLHDRRVKGIIKNLSRIVDNIASADEAMQFLPEGYNSPNSFNAGRITKSFSSLMVDAVTPMGGVATYDATDPEFGYENRTSVLVKHLFGLDLDELPASHKGTCAHISAYLKAASKNRKNITMAIKDRLAGIEYFLIMPTKFTPEKWKEVSTTAREERERRKGAARLLSEIDIPNLDAGGNIKGFMPHQVKVISDYASEADTNLTGVDPGGGKTILQLVDVILRLQKNPAWRPLIVTKPGLVKNFISEVNFFTKGKMNIVSLKKAQLAYISRTLRLTTADAVIRWIKNYPPNTMFICAYTDFSGSTKLFDDLEIPDRVMMQDVALPQFLHLLRIVGFDVVRFDESHNIKNMASKRSRYSYSLLAQAKSKALLSGTIINNTAIDLIGQAYGVNPMIFGSIDDVEKFLDDYNLPRGLIKSDEASQKLNARLKKFVQMSSATKEDWSFVLPDLYDKVIAPNLTPKQEKFYQMLMEEAELALRADLESGKKKSGDDDDDDGDEGDDGDSSDPTYDDEDENEAAFMMKADRSLAKAEQFLVAPDMNEQFLVWSEKPSGDDLVSPMVRGIDAELAKIYADRGADHSINKTAVFGIHKVASAHFMRHTKFRDLCLHYRAGDAETLRLWKADPDKYILVADSTSLREGENMQMLSYIFDMQATWTPGDYQQLISRMYRPDPKGEYNKDLVTHYWVTPVHKMNNPTIATVKLARMISKAISMARFKYESDPRWYEVSGDFQDLDLLTMNLETVFQSTHNTLAPYFNAWTKFTAWERRNNQKTRAKLATDIEAENPGVRLVDANGNILDRNLFTKLVMREAKSTTMLPGSKRVFTPWEKGALPADIHDLSLTILGSGEVQRGTYVMTEYGPAIVHSFTSSQVVVELFGKKKAKIYRSRIAIPNGQGVAKLNAIISNPSAWQNETYTDVIRAFTAIDADSSMAPRAGKKTAAPIVVKPSPVTNVKPSEPKPSTTKINIDDFKKRTVKPVEIEEEDEEEEEYTAIEEVYTYLINGMPALAIMDAPSGVENNGWKPVAPFVAMSFDTWATAEKFLGSLTKKFAIQKSKLDTLYAEMDEFRTGKTMRLTKRVTNEQARNFFISNHRKLSAATDGRERIDPYWVAIDKNVYLAFSKQSHSQRVFTWLTMMASKNKPRIKTPKNVPEMHINIFSTLNEAVADLKALGQAFDIPEAVIRQELRELKDDVAAMRGVRVKPTRTTR